MVMKRLLVCALVLGLAAPGALALEVITLSWREAHEVAALLAPHLRSGESASGINNQLILDASPARVRQLRRLISELDTKPVNLTVELALDGNQSSSSINWGGRITQSGPDGNYSTPGGWSVGTNSDNSSTQPFLRVLDNHVGYIALGQSRPLPWRLYDRRRIIAQGVEYRDAIQGLYVRPRLTGGERVVVDVAVSDDAFSGHQLNTARLNTTVEGRLGKWLTLGAIDQDRNGYQVLLLGAGARWQSSERLIRLRVKR
jgi:hypothetical protein